MLIFMIIILFIGFFVILVFIAILITCPCWFCKVREEVHRARRQGKELDEDETENLISKIRK